MVKISGKVLKTVLVSIFVLAGINGCKDKFTSVIPDRPVNLSYPIANYIELNVPGGWIYISNAGFGGIILFRDLVDSSNPFLAYDAACPYEYGVSMTRVVVTTDGSGVATCPKCGSQFMLFGGGGSRIKGPAAEPLKQYRTFYVGGRISITN